MARRAVARQLDEVALPTVRGVRRLIQGDPPDLCTHPAFVEAVASLAERDLVFEVCIFPRHAERDAIWYRTAIDVYGLREETT